MTRRTDDYSDVPPPPPGTKYTGRSRTWTDELAFIPADPYDEPPEKKESEAAASTRTQKSTEAPPKRKRGRPKKTVDAVPEATVLPIHPPSDPEPVEEMPSAEKPRSDTMDRMNGNSLYKLIGKGYETFWWSHALYRLVKGSKGSKKSKTAAIWFVHNLMKYPKANLLCIRKQANTIRDSVFADLEWAMAKLGCISHWVRSPSTMRMIRTYYDENEQPHHQIILFRGLDDPLKAGSISISESDGYLCWVWFEEFFEIESYEAFLKLTMSIRGEIPPETGLWKQYTMTFNPWSATSWIKEVFFDEPEKYFKHPETEVFTLTTTYKCNEFLSDVDRQQYEQLYISSPRMARIVCDGDWGIAEGLIYENWVEENFDIKEVLNQHPGCRLCFGLDFGYSISYNAFVALAVDVGHRELWVFDEWYERGQSNIDIAKAITRMGYSKNEIWADAAEPKSIYELQNGFKENVYDEEGKEYKMTWALPAIRPALKGPDSVMNGIQRLQSFRWHVHPSCKNTIVELQNYAFSQDKDGKWLEKPIKEFDHCLVAGTLVLTDRGQIPIEDVKVGDMVMTHLGYRKVLASGITRPEPAEIWRVTFENGMILEGTIDHPIVTTQGVKCLGSISRSDEVIQWEDQKVESIPVKPLNMMACCGTDTLMQKEKACRSISAVLSNIRLSTSIDTSGKNTTDLFQRGIRSIISMRIPLTMTSPIWNAFPYLNMCICTLGQRSIVNNRGGVYPILNVCSRKKVMNQFNSNANGAARHIILKRTEETGSVPRHVTLRPVEHPGSMTRTAFARHVAEHSESTSTARPGPALCTVRLSSDSKELAEACETLKIVDVSRTGRSEYVYDLTVDEAHDFFANSILVLNCMDAIRYASSPLLFNSKARVFEAKGDDRRRITTVPEKHSRRVFSSKANIERRRFGIT